MERLPYGRLAAAVIVGCLILALGISLIFVRPDVVWKHADLFTALFAGLSWAAFALIFRWWYLVLERRGYVVAPTISASVRRRALVLFAAFVAVMAGMVALEIAVYAVTRSRFIELAVVVGVGAPAMVVLTRLIAALAVPINARIPLPVQRFQLAMYALQFVVYTFTLVSMVRLRAGALPGEVQEFAIAWLALFAVTMPFMAYMQWKRYTEQQRTRMLPT